MRSQAHRPHTGCFPTKHTFDPEACVEMVPFSKMNLYFHVYIVISGHWVRNRCHSVCGALKCHIHWQGLVSSALSPQDADSALANHVGRMNEKLKLSTSSDFTLSPSWFTISQVPLLQNKLVQSTGLRKLVTGVKKQTCPSSPREKKQSWDPLTDLTPDTPSCYNHSAASLYKTKEST